MELLAKLRNSVILYLFITNKGLLSMKKTLVLLSLMISALVLTACNSNDPKKIKVESEDDKTFYAMGYMLGGNLQRLTLSDKELEALYKGITMSAKNEKSVVNVATSPSVKAA